MMDPEHLIADLRQRLLLPANEVREAERGWLRTSRAVAEGLEVRGRNQGTSSEFTRLKVRYLSIARYCSDARKLLDFHRFDNDAEDLKDRIIFTIDPHLLSAYSEPWHEGAHKGFFFLKNEETELSEEQKQQFAVLCYRSVFNSGSLAMLDSGRSEISRILAYFERSLDADRQELGKSQRVISELLADLHAAYVLENDKLSGIDAIKYLQQAFDNLMQIGGGPLLRQRLRLARLVQLMKSSSLRLHQWLKNSLLFVPLLMAMRHIVKR